MPGLITKRGKKRWRAQIMVNGILRQKLFPNATKKSYRDAVAWESETKKLLESETDTDSWTLLDWANEYLDYSNERYAQKTYKEKRSVFERLIRVFSPEMHVLDLSPAKCMSFLRKQASARSGYAANKDRKNLAAGWEWGRTYLAGFPQDDLNPFKAVKKFKEIRSPRYIPPEEDFWTVYESVEGQDKVMLLTCLHLAARRSELFNLTWADVDFGNNQVCLWTNKREDGNQEPDWLPMTTELRDALRRWWDERPIKDVAHVFVCLNPPPCTEHLYGEPFKYRQRFMANICKEAGVKPFGFHAIRHLTASILYRKGYSVGLIQAVLRHKSPTTTNRYLRSLGLEQVRDGLEEGLKGPAKVIEFKKQKNAL